LRRFITVDKTWMDYHYTPEIKQQSKQWIEAGGSAPKKAKIVSVGKVMATVLGFSWYYAHQPSGKRKNH
jgi:hypothetical protein